MSITICMAILGACTASTGHTDDLGEYILKAIEKRCSTNKNIMFIAETNSGNYEFSGDKIGRLKHAFPKDVTLYKQIGDSYYIRIERYPIASDKPSLIVQNFYDAKSGVNRGLVTHSDGKNHAAIETKPDRFIDESRFMYWVNNTHSSHAESIFKYLLDNRESWKLEVNDGKRVNLTVAWKPRWSMRPLGEKKLILDSERNYLPIKADSEWKHTNAKGGVEWRREKFVVDGARLIEDVWMPNTFTEYVYSSNQEPGVVTVYETRISTVESGKLKPEDLTLPFPDGAKVVDVPKGIVYISGNKISESNPEKLVGAPVTQNTNENSPKVSRRNWLIIIVTILTLIILAFIIYAGKRSKKKQLPNY